jgi:preprotein translocase subunit SecG
MKKIKYFLIMILNFFLTLFSLPALAENYGLDETVKVGKLNKALMVTDVNRDPTNFFSAKVGNILSIVLSFLGVLFLILIIVGGIKWMTSAGNQDKVKKAKDMIFSAIIGLVIIFAAYAVVAFIGALFIN